MPLISIVTSTFNSAETLERCLSSVANQSFRDIEHIVIDGSSTDGTVDILEKNGDFLAYWVSEPDSGIYDAWNKAVPHIRGTWVLFLGSDDYLYDNHALEQMSGPLMTAYPDYTVVYGKLIRVSQNSSEKLNHVGSPWEKMKNIYDYPTRKFTPHVSTFHHYSLFKGADTFDRSYKYSADSKFLGAALLDRPPLFVDTWVSCHSMGGVTSIVDTVLERWFEKYRITRELQLDVPRRKILKSFLKVLVKWSMVKLISAKQYRRISQRLNGKAGGQ